MDSFWAKKRIESALVNPTGPSVFRWKTMLFCAAYRWVEALLTLPASSATPRVFRTGSSEHPNPAAVIRIIKTD